MRVAMLLPVIVASGCGHERRATMARVGGRRCCLGSSPPSRLLVVANSLVPIPEFVREAGNTASRWCLVAAIAALGMKTHFKEIVEIGWKPVVLMVLETMFIAGLALIVIWGGWI